MNRPCLNCGIEVSENDKFCPECGCELLHEPEIPSKERNPPSIIKSAKKGFGIGAKFGLGIGVIFFLILIVGVIVGSSNTPTTTGSNINNQQPATLQKQSSSSNDSSSQDTITNDEIISKVEGHQATTASNTGSTQSSSSSTTTAEQQAIDFVQNYTGPSGNVVSISQIVTVIVFDAYPGENILDNPSTEHGWMALRDYNQNGNIWKVEFDLKTYRENVKIVWYANMDTHTIYSGNIIAKSILDAVNMPNNPTNNTLSNIHLT